MKVPRHVAIVCDGNGRWAKEHGKTRLAGHRAGADSIREVVRASAELGVEVLTLYGFSSENWSRPRREVSGLFRLLVEFLEAETHELVENGIRLRAIGRIKEIPERAREAVRRAEAETLEAWESASSARAPAGGRAAGSSGEAGRRGGLTVCLALSYGSQDEIVDAARELARRAAAGRLPDGKGPDDIDRDDVERHLYTSGLPPVDLLIRAGGEFRVSNFLLWQISYAELYFTRVYWPDFRRKHLEEAFAEYARRSRRFGSLGASRGREGGGR